MADPARSANRCVAFAAALLLAACGGGGASDPVPGTFAIRGTVSGAVRAGVTVTLTGAGTASTSTTTSAAGEYTFPGRASGSYTVTPTRAGHGFTPASRAVTVSGADVSNVDFTSAALPTHTISGTVSGAVSSGVTIALAGAASATTTTDGAGAYAFPGLLNGSYTVSPTRPGFDFTPPSRDVTVAGADVGGRDFVAAVAAVPPPPAAVTVRPADGGVTVVWTPSPGATSYRVYHGSTAALTAASPSVAATGTSAALGPFPNGERRFFAVSALGPGGESDLGSPRCGVPTASSATYGALELDLYDALCDDRLDHSRWYQPGGFSAGVSGGAMALSVDAVNLEPRGLRNHYANSSASVNSGGQRVTSLSSLVRVPQATASVTGGVQLRTFVRLAYQPPALRLAYPEQNRDFLAIEVGLAVDDAGVHVYRNAYHCDDGPCVVTGTPGSCSRIPAASGRSRGPAPSAPPRATTRRIASRCRSTRRPGCSPGRCPVGPSSRPPSPAPPTRRPTSRPPPPGRGSRSRGAGS